MPWWPGNRLPREQTPSRAGASSSRFDRLCDGGGTRRHDLSVREFGACFACRFDQLGVAAFSDALAQVGFKLLLFLQRKGVAASSVFPYEVVTVISLRIFSFLTPHSTTSPQKSTANVSCVTRESIVARREIAPVVSAATGTGSWSLSALRTLSWRR